MNLLHAHAALLKLGVPVFRTTDATAVLNVSPVNASQILRRLMNAGFFVQLKRGLWTVLPARSPLELSQYLVAPHSSYISLQTALYHHGMISQMPTVTYCITLTRTQRISTPLGTYSFHRMSPEFFFEFETRNGVAMASREKALLDLLYLRQTLPRLFGQLPELELPKGFSMPKCQQIIAKVRDPSRRTRIARELHELAAL